MQEVLTKARRYTCDWKTTLGNERFMQLGICVVICPQVISNEGECDPKDQRVQITDRSEEKRKANDEKKKQACVTTATGQKE